MNAETKTDINNTLPGWVAKIARDLEAAEDESRKIYSEELLEWVNRVLSEVLKMIFPTAKINVGEQSGVRFFGAVVGHIKAIINGQNGLEKKLDQLRQASERFDEELRHKLNKKAYQRLLEKRDRYQPDFERIAEIFDKIIDRKCAVIESAVNLAKQQSVTEQAEFFEAYSKALKTEIFDENGRLRYEKLSSTTSIYFLIVLYWPFVKKLPSVPALHGWLCNILGNSQVGNLDRIKGICRRFKITLARRGRPTKKKGC